MSLKKCPLCASGAETDHPAGITRSVRAIACKEMLVEHKKRERILQIYLRGILSCFFVSADKHRAFFVEFISVA